MICDGQHKKSRPTAGCRAEFFLDDLGFLRLGQEWAAAMTGAGAPQLAQNLC